MIADYKTTIVKINKNKVMVKLRMRRVHYYIILLVILFINSFISLSKDFTPLEMINIIISVFFIDIYTVALFDIQVAHPELIFVALLGLLTQLIVMVFLLVIGYNRIPNIETRLKNAFSSVSYNIPFRQIMFGLFFSISIISTAIFKFVEGEDWLNAMYYTVVTITTVGYGDVVSTHPITKTMTILLIFNGITFLGLGSQFLVDRIIRLQRVSLKLLPRGGIKFEDHIVIAGYGSKGRKLAELLAARRYTVVVIEQEPSRTEGANQLNIELFNADITKPANLKQLNLTSALAFFILVSDDNKTIQTSILARSIAPDLDIYAEFLSVPTYGIAKHAGVNKPISLFHHLLNVININLRKGDYIPLESINDMRHVESKLGYIILPIEADYSERFYNSIEVGYVNLSLDEVSVAHSPMQIEKLEDAELLKIEAKVNKTHVLLGVDKEELIETIKNQAPNITSEKFNRVIFAGYPEFAEEFLERINIPSENALVLWKDEIERIKLQNKEYTTYQWHLEEGIDLLTRLVRDGDLVVCSFDDITSSMLVSVAVRNSEKSTHLIQVVPYEYDIEPLVQIGAELVLTPQRIISDAMISSFLKENHLSPSFMFTDGHIYEHLVLFKRQVLS